MCKAGVPCYITGLGAFGGTGFLFLGRFGSRANAEKKGSGLIMSNFLARFFQLFMAKNLFFQKKI